MVAAAKVGHRVGYGIPLTLVSGGPRRCCGSALLSFVKAANYQTVGGSFAHVLGIARRQLDAASAAAVFSAAFSASGGPATAGSRLRQSVRQSQCGGDCEQPP